MPTNTAAFSPRYCRDAFLSRLKVGIRTTAWLVEAIRLTRKLQGKAETNIVVAVVRPVVVAVR